LESRKITTTSAQANVGSGLIIVGGRSNSAFGQANLAFTQANTSYGSFGQANLAFSTANSAANVAASAFGQANLAFNTANSASGHASNAFNVANIAFATANTANSSLNASNLASGTVPSARISGSYGSLTGVGTISSGTWNGTSISTTYTDAKVTSVATRTGAVTLSQSDISGLNTASSPKFASLGIGTDASGTVGEIRATGEITAGYSDDKLKTRLGNIENALDKVSAISGFFYEPNKIAQDLGFVVKREVGVSAQEVQAIMPEVVAPAPVDKQYLTVHYEKLIPLLIEAIKELKTEVDEIKGQIK
jgi:hypothetical protein